MKLKIRESEGKKFSVLSGDNNRIHLNDLTGYNSLFGEKICHACLVILKIFRIIKIIKIISNLNSYSIKIKFFKHFSYNDLIYLKLNKKNIQLIKIFQNNILKAIIEIEKNNTHLNYNFGKKKISLKLNKKSIKFFNRQNQMGILSMLLNNLTKYVGTIYPGEKSIISEININYNEDFNFNTKKTEIFSKKIDKRFSIIKNKITFKKYLIEFKSLERPFFKFKKTKLKKKLIKLSKKIKENILIIGASSGIGNEILNLFKNNNKIKIIATYNNNILIKNKNLIIKKINLNKSIYSLKNIIKKNSPLIIYYLATPKINLNLNDIKSYKSYKNFYIKYPIKILSYAKNFKIKFFYPSTIFINNNYSNYSKIKKIAEKKLSSLKNKKHIINILRIDEVNTKQNLSLTPKYLPSFTELLNKKKNYQRKIFFEDK